MSGPGICARDPVRHRTLARLRWLIVCLVAVARQAGADVVYPVDEVKAAFLYRFGGFISWPALDPAAPHFVIAVLGAPGVASALLRMAPALRVNGRPVVVRTPRSAQNLDAAQLVYVGEGRPADLRGVIASAQGKPMLVVSDGEEGLRAGSAINLLVVERRVRFEVSLPALQRNGLSASSQLLTLALRVQPANTALNGAGAPR